MSEAKAGEGVEQAETRRSLAQRKDSLTLDQLNATLPDFNEIVAEHQREEGAHQASDPLQSGNPMARQSMNPISRSSRPPSERASMKEKMKAFYGLKEGGTEATEESSGGNEEDGSEDDGNEIDGSEESGGSSGMTEAEEAKLVKVGNLLIRGLEIFKVFGGVKAPQKRILWTDERQTTLFTAKVKNEADHLKEFKFTAIDKFVAAEPSRLVSAEKTEKRFVMHTKDGNELQIQVDTNRSRNILVDMLQRLVDFHAPGQESQVVISDHLEVGTAGRWVKRYFVIDGHYLKTYHSAFSLRMTSRKASSRNHIASKEDLELLQTVMCDPNNREVLQLRFATSGEEKALGLRCANASQCARWQQQLEFFVSELYAERRALNIKQTRSGYLWKEAISSKHKNWKRRYFILGGDAKLRYYEDEKAAKPPFDAETNAKGCIDLTGDMVITPGHIDPTRELSMVAGDTTLLLYAELAIEAVAWIQLLFAETDKIAAANAATGIPAAKPAKPKGQPKAPSEVEMAQKAKAVERDGEESATEEREYRGLSTAQTMI
jgi:hypothetical protein